MPETQDGSTAEWRPDPSGRYEWRRFFLGQPTSLVMRGEVVGYDQIDPPAPDAARYAPPAPPVPSWSPAAETQDAFLAPPPPAPGAAAWLAPSAASFAWPPPPGTERPLPPAASPAPHRPPPLPAATKSRVPGIGVPYRRTGTGRHRRRRRRDLVPDRRRACPGLGALAVAACHQRRPVVGHYSQRVGRAVARPGRGGVIAVHHNSTGWWSNCRPGWLVRPDRRCGPWWIECHHDPTGRQVDFGFGRRITLGDDAGQPDLDQPHPHDHPDANDHGSERRGHGSRPPPPRANRLPPPRRLRRRRRPQPRRQQRRPPHHHHRCGDDDLDRPGPVHS